jgi:hypothetical protein
MTATELEMKIIKQAMLKHRMWSYYAYRDEETVNAINHLEANGYLIVDRKYHCFRQI